MPRILTATQFPAPQRHLAHCVVGTWGMWQLFLVKLWVPCEKSNVFVFYMCVCFLSFCCGVLTELHSCLPRMVTAILRRFGRLQQVEISSLTSGGEWYAWSEHFNVAVLLLKHWYRQDCTSSKQIKFQANTLDNLFGFKYYLPGDSILEITKVEFNIHQRLTRSRL